MPKGIFHRRKDQEEYLPTLPRQAFVGADVGAFLRRRGEVVQHIPIPVEIKTGRELMDLLKAYRLTFPIPKVQVIAASGDEERVQALFAATGELQEFRWGDPF